MPTVIGMRTAAAALALGFTLTAAGVASCSGPEGPGVTLTPEPGVTPVYSSDEEALAAAEELYGRYLEVTDDLGASGWTDTGSLADVTRGVALQDELDNAEDFAAKRWVQQGRATFDSMVIQRVEDHGPGTVLITVYLCLDVTAVDVVNSSGDSVVSPSRPARQPLEVDVDDLDGALKLSRSEAWSGANFC